MENAPPPETDLKPQPAQNQGQKIFLMSFFTVVGIVVVIALFSVSSFIFIKPSENQQAVPENPMGERSTKMGLTSFDAGLAKKFMDKDNDGKCDACGMPVEMCMGSGQLQCNMDSESTIGDLGSQHIHADLKIYVNGKVLGDEVLEPLAMDMSKKDSMITSSFIHLEEAPAPEKTGDLLHMHATGVPLWIWFESVGWKLDSNCLETGADKKYCTDAKNSLKFYVNGKPNNELENYVFNDLDKILISYGEETPAEIEPQLAAITDFAKLH